MMQSEIDKSYKDSFDALNFVNKDRKKNISYLKKLRRHMQITMLYLFIFEGITSEHNNDSINDINSVVDELKYEKNLLNNIKDSYNKLKKINTLECTYELNILLYLIAKKNRTLLYCLDDDIAENLMANRNFSFQRGNGNRIELTEINNKIDNYVSILGLNKKRT